MFDEEVNGVDGVLQARYVDEHADLRDGYGVIHETAPLHPHLHIPFTPWEGGAAHFALMEALDNTCPWAYRCATATAARSVSAATESPWSATSSRTSIVAICDAESTERPNCSRRRARGASSPRTRSGWPATPACREPRDGRLAGHLGLRPHRTDLGGARPLRLRRLGVPDRTGVNPHFSIQSVAHMNARGLAARLT